MLRLAGVAEGWALLELNAQYGALVPTADLITHDAEGEGRCICTPVLVPVACTDGTTGGVYVHSALDGRGEAGRGTTDQDQR